MPFRRHTQLLLVRTRLFQAVLLTAGLILLVRIVWGVEATIRLASVRSQIPLLPYPDDDAATAQQILADQHNAAGVLMEAVRSMHIEESDILTRPDGRPFFFGRGFGMRMDPAHIRSILQANSTTLQLIDKATRLTEVRWPITTHSIEESTSTASSAVSAYPLRMLLASAADITHQNGNDAAAFDHLRRLQGIAHILDLAPDLNSHVVAAGMRSEVATILERWEIHPTAANSDILRQFVDQLFTEQATTGAMIARSFDYETSAYEHWAIDAYPGLSEWWLKPMALDAFARRLALQQKISPVTQARNWPQVMAVPRVTPMARNSLNLAVMTVSEPRLDIIEVMRMHFRAQCDCRAVAVLLAADLYRLDHHAYPTTLTDMVPTYLPLRPVDPFHADSEPLHYRLDPHGPTVWSVGENGLDEGASVSFLGTSGGPGGGPGRGGFGGGMGFMGWGYGRRYSQPDIVYGAAYRDALIAARGF